MEIISIGNMGRVRRSKICACYYCERIFDPSEIKDNLYIKERDNSETAQCPYCYTDSIICDIDNFDITPESIRKLHNKNYK